MTKNEAKRMLCVYASEIAALIGKNRFVSKDDAIQKVIKRHKPECMDNNYVKTTKEAKEVFNAYKNHLDNFNKEIIKKDCIQINKTQKEKINEIEKIEENLKNEIENKIVDIVNEIENTPEVKTEVKLEVKLEKLIPYQFNH